jgi:hypothetical protein
LIAAAAIATSVAEPPRVCAFTVGDSPERRSGLSPRNSLAGANPRYPATMSDDLPTPRSTLRHGGRVRVWCRGCRHTADADLQALIDRGHGDAPLVRLPCRCTACGHAGHGVVVSNGYQPLPWR